LHDERSARFGATDQVRRSALLDRAEQPLLFG
jgi:hypothetical protein